MKLARPFVRLPYRFDVSRLTEEISRLDERAWMDHPNRMQGNSAVALVSVDGGDNDAFTGRMMETPHLHQCEYMRQIMANFDEVIARSRLMRLAPGSEVNEHVDFNYHWYSRIRIHIPITTTPEVIFYCGNDHVHMQPGECWIFDSWRRHKVVNASDHTRVHLVIDTTGSGKFWRMVHNMEAQDNQRIETEFFGHTPGKTVDVRTEKYNVSPVMAPGELEAMINELVRDFSAEPNNPPNLVRHYSGLLESLAKDWRALWLEYGWEEQAVPRYEALLTQTVRQLHPEMRALVSSSNDVGINPIIMQRIIRAALFKDERARFSPQSGN